MSSVDILDRGVTNIIPDKTKLQTLIDSGKKLNIYLGIDPTATKIHLGHVVPLRKLNEFAKMGHNITFLIGDFTALIGDTSDKDKERPVLTYSQIQKNFKTYKSQAEKIVDFSKIKVKFNSQWLKELRFTEIVKLCQNFSMGDFVSRELIRERLKKGKRVGLHETLYPVMQGYDSYHLDTDIQIGGADQTFNMQAGRTLLNNIKNKQSFILVTGYLEGTDGMKMSKTANNAIWINDPAIEMYAKVMSLKDDLIGKYFTLSTSLPLKKVADEIKVLESGKNPIVVKKRLAFQIVKEIHSAKNAEIAQNNFEKTFQEKKPDYQNTIKKKNTLIDTLSPLVESKSKIKRLIDEGAIDINGNTIKDYNVNIKLGDKIKVGQKIFVKVIK